MARAALVTGGSSGIGLAIARMLRENGFELTLAARTHEKVEAAAEELGRIAVAANVAKEEDCRRVGRGAPRAARPARRARQLRRGRRSPARSTSSRRSGIDLQLDINLRGTMLVTAAALPLLRETQRTDREHRVDRRNAARPAAAGLRRDEGGRHQFHAHAQRGEEGNGVRAPR